MESVKKMTLQQLLHLDFNGWTPPEGTMRFSTGNLNSEGVGDTIQAHAMNRNIEIEIGKPTVSEMEKYALDNGWTQEILVLLREVPECLDDYRDMDDAQITGSASSYARKYALNGLFAIDDTKDPDATNKHGNDKPIAVVTPSEF